MGVLMPSAGIIYAKFGLRWPAVIGPALTVIGTYLLVGVNLDTSNTTSSGCSWPLVGMGLARC